MLFGWPTNFLLLPFPLQYDAEIIYLETREQDQIHQLENITQELNKTDQMYRQGYDQVSKLTTELILNSEAEIFIPFIIKFSVAKTQNKNLYFSYKLYSTLKRRTK